MHVKSTQILFLTTLLFGFIQTSEAGITLPLKCEKVLDKKMVTSMPGTSLRFQNSTGQCYLFASAALIQQKYCKEKRGGCKFPKSSVNSQNITFSDSPTLPINPKYDDRLSILDALHQGSKGKDGGFSYETLNLLKGKSLARESCIPFLSRVNDAGLGDSSSPFTKMKECYEEYQKKSSGKTDHESIHKMRCHYSEKISKYFKLDGEINDIMRGLHKKKLFRVPGGGSYTKKM